jgi:Tol biopolymer transport system component
MKGDEFGNSSEWEKVKSFKPKVHRISLYSVNGLEASFQKNIFETIEMIWSARLSSDGRYLASVITQCLSMKNDSLSVVDSFERPDLSLWISSMDDPKQRMKLAENAGVWTAWSPTGNSLAFLSVDRWATNEGRTLATLRHWEVDPLVMQTTGDVPPNSTELLQLAALPFTKLSMLPDGKILVAAEEVTLPWVPSKQFESPFLYLIDPKFPSRLTKISPRLRDEDFDQALLIGSFQVSPDGQQLAFTSKDSGTGILTIATGEVTWVEPPVEEKSGSGGIQTPSPIAPSWNKSGEFVYLAPGKSTVTKSDRAELVLWGPNKLVNLSQKWEWFEPFR